MITLRQHLRLLIYVTIFWILFVLIGLPDYYQHWPLKRLLYLCILTYFFVGAITYRWIKKFNGNRFLYSLVVASYIVIPLFVYDYIYIDLVRNEPFDLLNRFWFLSIFYVIPWYQAPLLYFYISAKRFNRRTWLTISVLSFIIAFVLHGQWAAFEGSFFDPMVSYPERSSTMLGSAIKLSIYGTLLSLGFLSLFRV